MLKKAGSILDFTLRFALHIGIALFALSSLKPVALKAHPKLAASLWSGQDKAYIVPGSQFKIFKPYLPKTGQVSLILDRPNRESPPFKETSYDAQNYFAPLIINLETVEPAALVYCSTQDTAEKRLTETGYVWTYKIAPGKGLARKTV